MATLIQSVTNEAIATNPVTATWGVATTTGNKLVACFMTDHSGTVNSVTGVTGGGVTTWARDFSVGNATAGSICIEGWSGAVTAGATTAETIAWSTASNTHLLWFIDEWSGLGAFDKVSAIGAGSGQGSSTAALSATSGVLGNANSIAIGLVEWRTSSTTTATVGSGYSNMRQFQSANGNIMGGAIEYQSVAGTSAVTASFGLGTSNAWGCIVAAYQDNAAVAATASPKPYQGNPPQNVQRSYFW